MPYSVPYSSVVKKFLVVFLPLALVAGLAAWGVEKGASLNRRAKVASLQTGLVRTEEQALSVALAARADDAAFLADNVANIIQSGHAPQTAQREIGQLFLSFGGSYPAYDQIRFLSPKGRELARVNRIGGGVQLTPRQELQDKSAREYFKQALTLKPGRVYLSRFDLNVEHGKVEVPFRPMLRFSSLCLARDGSLLGVVVLNFNGQPLLERIRQAASSTQGSLFLANQRGFWLAGPKPEMEWGFMVPERSGFRAGAKYPSAWRDMQAKQHGQFSQDCGLITYVHIDLNRSPTSQGLPWRLQPAEGWYLFSLASHEDLASGLAPALYLAALWFLVMAGIVLWLWAVGRVRRELAEKEISEREEMMTTMGRAALDGIIMVDDQQEVFFLEPGGGAHFRLQPKRGHGGQTAHPYRQPGRPGKGRARLRAV